MNTTYTLINKSISFFISLVLILMIVPISSSADSGVIYESEINNMFSTADFTYDDKTNYGQIDSVDDVDFWTITYT